MDKMTLQQAIHLLETGTANFGTIMYKAEDIITLLNNIEQDQPESTGISTEALEDLKADILSKFEAEIDCTSTTDLVDFNTADFRLSGNEIYLNDISINYREMENCLESAIDRVFNNFKERKEANNEQ